MVAWLIAEMGSLTQLFSYHPATYYQHHLSSRGPTGIAIFVVFQVGLWFYAYRDDEGYYWAAATGLACTVPLIAVLFLPEVTDERLPVSLLLLFCYLSFSYFAYAIASWNRSRRSWLDGL